MTDVEKRLREVGEILRRGEAFSLAPSKRARRRIRVHRVGVVLSVVVLLGGLSAAGLSTAGVFDRSPTQTVDQPELEIDGPDVIEGPLDPDCGLRFGFVPTYLPPGFAARPQPGSGGERGVPLAQQTGSSYGHFAGEGFINVLGVPAFAQTNRSSIEVLGRKATLGDIHEGYSVEFRYRGCSYVLAGYGIERDELRRFALGLEPREDRTPDRSQPPEAFALWPEDTPAEAESGCRDEWRRRPYDVMERFALEVLGWEAVDAPFSEAGQNGFRFLVERTDQGSADGDAASIEVFLREVTGSCWSVTSVSRPPDDKPKPGAIGISIRGRSVEIGFDPLGADSAIVEIGHGRYKSSSERAFREGRATFLLTYEPDEPGHFLILYKDEAGEIFSASGGPLPAGDFATG